MPNAADVALPEPSMNVVWMNNGVYVSTIVSIKQNMYPILLLFLKFSVEEWLRSLVSFKTSSRIKTVSCSSFSFTSISCLKGFVHNWHTPFKLNVCSLRGETASWTFWLHLCCVKCVHLSSVWQSKLTARRFSPDLEKWLRIEDGCMCTNRQRCLGYLIQTKKKNQHLSASERFSAVHYKVNPGGVSDVNLLANSQH